MIADRISYIEGTAASAAERLASGARNVAMMHALQRIARAFDDCDISLMAVKGAALNLTLYEVAAERPMADLDLLVAPQDADRARAVLERLGARRGRALLREDFFPRFVCEIEYTIGCIFPVRIDLHVRPFRPLRYARLVPDDALWQSARRLHFGNASLFVPGNEEMLIHLAVHASVHGNATAKWSRDIEFWCKQHGGRIDWDRFVRLVLAWNLVLPVRRALQGAGRRSDGLCPAEVIARLEQAPSGWRDRLALWQAPRDAQHLWMQVLVNLLCTPGLGFRLRYLAAVMLPGRRHMAGWYGRRHRGWLACAHLLRWIWPAMRYIRPLASRLSKLETRRCPVHGPRVFVTLDVSAGEVIANFGGPHAAYTGTRAGRHGPEGADARSNDAPDILRTLHHCARPNAALSGSRLVALRQIRKGEEISINRGFGDTPSACASDDLEGRAPEFVRHPRLETGDGGTGRHECRRLDAPWDVEAAPVGGRSGTR